MKKIALLGLWCWLFAFTGIVQANYLYLTEYETNHGAIVDTSTGTLVNTFTTTVSTETGIAVGNTVRIIAGFIGSAGSEYNLAGNVIQSGVYPNGSYDSLYDGTTDGVYNYSIDHNGTQQVWQFDTNWQNGTVLFQPQERASGIAYDPNTNTLWLTVSTSNGAPNGNIQQYSMGGQLLSEFTPASGGSRYGLAFDSTTNTLWTSDFGSGMLWQYDTSGNLLQQLTVPGLNMTSPFGMEFPLSTPLPVTTEVPIPTLSGWAMWLLIVAVGFPGIVLARRQYSGHRTL